MNLFDAVAVNGRHDVLILQTAARRRAWRGGRSWQYVQWNVRAHWSNIMEQLCIHRDTWSTLGAFWKPRAWSAVGEPADWMHLHWA